MQRTIFHPGLSSLGEEVTKFRTVFEMLKGKRTKRGELSAESLRFSRTFSIFYGKIKGSETGFSLEGDPLFKANTDL